MLLFGPTAAPTLAAWSRTRTSNGTGWPVGAHATCRGSWDELNSPAAFRLVQRDQRVGPCRHGMPFAVCLREDGSERLVGHLNVGSIVRRAFCSAYAGYWVDSRVAGQGVIPTALALAVDHAFGPGGLHRIEVNIRPENAAVPAGGGEAGLPRRGVPRPLHAHRRGLARPHRIRHDRGGCSCRGWAAGPLAPPAWQPQTEPGQSVAS